MLKGLSGRSRIGKVQKRGSCLILEIISPALFISSRNEETPIHAIQAAGQKLLTA